MRELLRLGDLLHEAKRAKTPEDVKAALVSLLQHLYDNEREREMGLLK